MGFTDPNSIHNPTTGTAAPAAWGDILRDDLVYLSSVPQCSVSDSSTTNVSSSTATPGTNFSTCDTERYDTDGMHSTTVNSGRITCVTAGKYEVGARVEWDTGAVDSEGRRELRVVHKNSGGSTLETFLLSVMPGVQSAITNGVCHVVMSAGDYVSLYGVQNSGSILAARPLEFYAQLVST